MGGTGGKAGSKREKLTFPGKIRPYMQYYFKRFFVLHFSRVIFLFPIKKSMQKAIEIEIAFIHPFENPKDHTLDPFFHASHIRHKFPNKLRLLSMS